VTGQYLQFKRNINVALQCCVTSLQHFNLHRIRHRGAEIADAVTFEVEFGRAKIAVFLLHAIISLQKVAIVFIGGINAKY